MLYDPATGEVFFDVGENIAIFGFSHDEIINGVVSPFLGVPATQDDATGIGWFSAAALPDGEAGIGLVLPAGLDPATLGWIYQPLVGGSFTTAQGATPVPEPGTLVLLGIGVLGLLLWRRRR